MTQGSSFQASTDEDEDARALAAKLKIPWEDWVKTHGVCHHCGEKGHIRPKCPKYLADIAAGKIKRTDLRDNTRVGSRNPGTPGNSGKQRFNEKYKNSSKFKTLLAAFQAWSTDENDDDNNEEQVETPQENDVGKDDDEDAFGFFSALASLKE